MNLEDQLKERSESKCELCRSKEALSVFVVPPNNNLTLDETLLICSRCQEQIENPETFKSNHWRCLNDSIWSAIPAVQVMSWRLLNRIKDESWPQDLLEMVYLDGDIKKWAVSDKKEFTNQLVTVDINGTKLANGDSVTTTKDLVIRGANFTAKRGTMVKNIHLTDNPREIEGRVNGSNVVLGAHTVKKA